MATVTTHQVDEESPLIRNSNNDNGEEPLGEIEGFSRREKAVAGVSTVSCGTSVAAMFLERSPLVYVSGLIGVAVAPYVAIQQQKITHVEALAKTNQRSTS
jgi:hypothetical protein